jgi:hypothetical protein
VARDETWKWQAVRITAAIEPSRPDAENEDWLGIGSRSVVVLDGVTVPRGMPAGCAHGTPWYVRRLGARLLALAENEAGTLTAALGRAIAAVAAEHPDCDLESLGAPSAAVAVLRVDGHSAEYLALADVSIALETDAGLKVVTDDRVSASVDGLDWSAPDVAARIAGRRAADRNRPGGYWVAAADPAAAGHALAGSVTGLVRAAVLTDGAARAADLLGMPWASIIGMDAAGIIAAVRAAERRDAACERWPRYKVSDDAAAVTWET